MKTGIVSSGSGLTVKRSGVVCILLLFVLLVNCKRKDREEPLPLPPVATEPAMPFGIQDFMVEGVPKENIRFTALYRDAPNDQVVITLPENYPFGDSLKVTMKLPEGYVIKNVFQGMLDPKGFSVNYGGYNTNIAVINTATGNQAGGLQMTVDPVKPIVVPSVGHGYDFMLEGEEIYVPIQALNWGTPGTLADRGPSQPDSVVHGQVLFRNLKTGTVSVSRLAYSSLPENKSFEMRIPATLEAGDYEMTPVRHNRRAVVPDRLSLKYGAPKFAKEYNYNRSVFNDKSNIITYKGYNLLPGHTYEIELWSDFFPKKRFPLVPVDHLTMVGDLPPESEPGTYKSALYIDGKVAVTFVNPLTTHNLVFIHKDQRQPALSVLSQSSSRFSTYTGFKLYEPASSLKRTEPVLALYESPPGNPGVPSNDTRLFFKNTETGTEYTLPQTGFSTGMLPYRMYKSPDELPSGKYQVRFGIRYNPEAPETVSGLYYSEIVVE